MSNYRPRCMLRKLMSQFREVDGSQLVEFALCIPILLTVFFGVVYFSYVIFAAHFVTNAANDGARYAIVRGSGWNGSACASTSTVDCTATGTDVSSFVASTLPAGLNSAKLSVSTTWPGTTAGGGRCDAQNGNNSPNCVVIVQTKYVVSFPLPFVSSSGLTVSSSAAMTIAQ